MLGGDDLLGDTIPIIELLQRIPELGGFLYDTLQTPARSVYVRSFAFEENDPNQRAYQVAMQQVTPPRRDPYSNQTPTRTNLTLRVEGR